MLEERPNQAVAITCDAGGCHMEVLGPSEADAGEDASLMGWKFLADGRHACPDCQAGKSTSAARARAMYGVSDVVVPKAPRDVAEGEEVYAPTGQLIGKAAHAAEKGEPLRIALHAPAPGEQAESGRPDSDEGLAIEEAPLVVGGHEADPSDAN